MVVNLKKKVLLIPIILILIFFISSDSKSQPTWTINGSSVYIDDSNAYINVNPHTLTQSEYITIDFKTKSYTGDVDMYFGVPNSTIKPSSAELYNPRNVSVEKSYTCNQTFNYTLNPNIFNCFNTTTLIYTHSFETGNITTKTAYWHENQTQDWQSIASLFTEATYNYDGFSEWYYANNLPVTANTNYKLRTRIDVPIGSYGKYGLAFKPSSETLAQAISNNHFYYLDPFWNTTNIQEQLGNNETYTSGGGKIGQAGSSAFRFNVSTNYTLQKIDFFVLGVYDENASSTAYNINVAIYGSNASGHINTSDFKGNSSNFNTTYNNGNRTEWYFNNGSINLSQSNFYWISFYSQAYTGGNSIDGANYHVSFGQNHAGWNKTRWYSYSAMDLGRGESQMGTLPVEENIRIWGAVETDRFPPIIQSNFTTPSTPLYNAYFNWTIKANNTNQDNMTQSYFTIKSPNNTIYTYTDNAGVINGNYWDKNFTISNIFIFNQTNHLGNWSLNATLSTNNSNPVDTYVYYNFSIYDSTNPQINLSEPTGTKSSQTVTGTFNISDNIELSYCYYNVTTSADVIVIPNRQIYNCSTNTSVIFDTGADYTNMKFKIWANDTSNNANYSTLTFTVDTTVTPTTTGGGGGGTITPTECNLSKNTLLLHQGGTKSYQYVMSPEEERKEHYIEIVNGEIEKLKINSIKLVSDDLSGAWFTIKEEPKEVGIGGREKIVFDLKVPLDVNLKEYTTYFVVSVSSASCTKDLRFETKIDVVDYLGYVTDQFKKVPESLTNILITLLSTIGILFTSYYLLSRDKKRDAIVTIGGSIVITLIVVTLIILFIL